MTSPFPPPTHPTMYRATGLLRGQYRPHQEAFTKGSFVADDGLEFPCVLVGTVARFLQHHPEILETQQIWRVWPRTFPDSPGLFFQIWAVHRGKDYEGQAALSASVNAFSIRGIVVYQDETAGKLAVRIQRNQRPPEGKEQERRWKPFNLVIDGFLPGTVMGQFWELDCCREGELLLIEDARFIQDMNRPKQSKPNSTELKPKLKLEGKPTFTGGE